MSNDFFGYLKEEDWDGDLGGIHDLDGLLSCTYGRKSHKGLKIGFWTTI